MNAAMNMGTAQEHEGRSGNKPKRSGSSGLKGVALLLVLTALVFAALALFADFDATLNSLQRVTFDVIALALLASSANFVFRFFRWALYLRVIGVRLRQVESLGIFLSGLAMSVTPGKVGELFKAVAVSSRTDTTVEEASAVVIAERVLDLVAVVVLVAVGASYLTDGVLIAAFSGAFAAAALLFLSSKRVADFLLSLLRKVRGLSAIADRIDSVWTAIQKLNALGVLIPSLLLSTAAWFGQCAALYIIATALGDVDLHIFHACALYCAPLLAGVVSLIPGGVGAAEATMLALIESSTSLLRPDALAATMLTRFVTLWWAVLVGALPAFLVLRSLRSGGAEHDEEKLSGRS